MKSEQKTSMIINITLWIAQVFLALTFIGTGFMKIVQPEQLPFPWIKDSRNLVLITGMIDLLGGIGIILPTLLRIQPKLTNYASYGIIALMTAAIVFHVSRGEAKDIGFNIFIALLATFVAWGRQTKLSIKSKNNEVI